MERQIVLFPFAGGSSQSFNEVLPWLREDFEPVFVDYPGHHLRCGEKLLTTVPELAQQCWHDVHEQLRPGYLVFGMSLGAFVAFEFALLAKREGLPPVALVALSAVAPSRVDSSRGLAELPDDEFVQALRTRYPGELSTMATGPMVRDFVLPILRTDISAFDDYGSRVHGIVEIPILAVGGIQDSSVSYSNLLAWSAHSARQVVVKRVPGGHFFLGESGTQVVGDLMLWLDELELPTAWKGSDDASSAARAGYGA